MLACEGRVEVEMDELTIAGDGGSTEACRDVGGSRVDVGVPLATPFDFPAGGDRGRKKERMEDWDISTTTPETWMPVENRHTMLFKSPSPKNIYRRGQYGKSLEGKECKPMRNQNIELVLIVYCILVLPNNDAKWLNPAWCAWAVKQFSDSAHRSS
jgi:hypothetical protein